MSKYSIGLDIGTNSVGWAVVDDNNQLVKKNGKTLWGVRMFEEASDASETRGFRTNRRRLERRKYRINLLKSVFIKEINEVDPTFFQRLDDSFYKIEDKQNANFYNLFVNEYTDKEFFNQFPTIFHLRKYLCESNKKEDIRYIYLALHHMVKYRGNFLYQGDKFNKSDDSKIKEIFEKLNILLAEYASEFEDYSDYFQSVEIEDDFFMNLKSILVSEYKTNDKKRTLKDLFKADNKTLINECIIPLLIGSKCNISGLYPVKEYKYEKCDIQVNIENLESEIETSKTKVPEMARVLDFVLYLKEVVDYYFLIRLLQGGNTLSGAMIKKYDEHNQDLKLFKRLVKENIPNKYNECFRKNEKSLNNYVSYVGFNSTESKISRFGHCSRDSFYTYVQSLLKLIKSDKCKNEIDYIIKKIENNNFLLRQNSDQNGSLPMQLNLEEMVTILEKQSKFYPFLLEIDKDGFSNINKIISVFKYVVPYYVGPLNVKSDRSWLVRSGDKVYPWNFEQVVNIDESAKNFIQNMQRKCTYLKGDDDYCLPKKSIIFSAYNCLTYLNKLSINGALIPQNIKRDLFINVFLKNKKPTKKTIINYLISNYGALNVTTSKLKDLPDVTCDMSSYIKFSEIFGDDIKGKVDFVEQIIKDIVIFSDKNVLEKRLINVYKLDKEIIKQIKDLNYQGYGNLSRKLLNGLNVKNPTTGEIHGTVIDIMMNTNLNLQEILYLPDYRLIDTIDEYNAAIFKDSEYDTLEDFLNNNIAISPIMKRPLIQAHTIISEVRKILNKPIDKYYVECTRTNQAEKKKTISRYEKLKQLYANSKELALEYNINLKNLNDKLDYYKDNLKSDLLYLYFTQLGKCMYSLEDIDINNLFSSNTKYDIDHIYPQSLIKDDSFNNKVLVLKSMNNAKQDNLLFEMSSNFLNLKCFAFFEKLKDLQLITKEKYKRLTKKELSSNEIEVFVNRQLVATNQAVKGLIQVLKLYDNVDPTDIVYSKAENITMARQLFDLPKSRTANNFHHAHDAYLNVVIGRIINDYFVTNHFNGAKDYYRMKVDNKTINIERLLKYSKWVSGSNKYNKEDVIKILNKNLYNRFDVNETTKTSNPNSLFSKVTINPAGHGTVPVKQNGPRSDIEKYGGITSHSYCKYIIVETINKKGNKEYILESIPKAFDKHEDEYLLSQGYTNYIIKHNNIKTNVVIEDGPLKYCITGRSSQYLLKNLNDKYFNKECINIIKKLDKYNKNALFEIPMNYYDSYVVLSPAKDEKCNGITLTKSELKYLYLEIQNKYSSTVYSYSIIQKIVCEMKQINPLSKSLIELIEINNELLKLLQTNARKTANLKLLGLSANSGTLSLSKKLSPGMKFISESVTGYYKKVLFEVPNDGI